MSSPVSRKPRRRLTKTVVVRLPPQLYRSVIRRQSTHETLSETIRRLLSITEHTEHGR